MFLLDVHTHFPSREDERAIVQDVHSVGIHPWKADMKVMNILIDKCEHNDNKEVVAIGECGLDKLCTTPFSLQIEVFRQQIELSEQYGLPLIIHCVKAMDELLALHKEYNPNQPWIWHGFRGKPQQLYQLLKAEFYISFGFKYNVDSLRACPIDRMLLESDTVNEPIHILYNKVAEQLNIEIEYLADSLASNTIFGGLSCRL